MTNERELFDAHHDDNRPVSAAPIALQVVEAWLGPCLQRTMAMPLASRWWIETGHGADVFPKVDNVLTLLFY